MGGSRRSVQDWEGGVKYPTAQRLQALVLALLEAGGPVGHEREAVEHQETEIWTAR